MYHKPASRLCTMMLILAALVLLAACKPSSSQEVTITGDANGTSVTLPSSQALAVRLESNPTTGYSWAVAECDMTLLKPRGEPVYEEAKSGEKLTGGGGWETFRFDPQKTGQTSLKIVYRRPWEKDVAPIKTFEVKVTVE